MSPLTRRKILEILGASALAIGGSALAIERFVLPHFSAEAPVATRKDLHEAKYYDTAGGDAVTCNICARNCTVQDGKRGFCRSRANLDGQYFSLVYGNPVAVHIDPIEKLPLKHVFPGMDSICVGTACCNFQCLNCINAHIAIQAPEDVEAIPKAPQEIVQLAKNNGVSTICFTYNEPTIAYEYVYDVFKLAKESGLRTAFHTNGYMKPEPARELLEYVDAVAVDLKAFDPGMYRKLTTGELSPVLEFLELVKREDNWLEVVNLVVPTYSDDVNYIRDMCAWVKGSLSPDVPLHFSRFFPTYRLEKLSPTPVETLEMAYECAKSAGLNYVYIDNVPGHQYGNTFCPHCGEKIVERKEYIVNNKIENGSCPLCGEGIPGLWKT